jgi:hypothetical protein
LGCSGQAAKPVLRVKLNRETADCLDAWTQMTRHSLRQLSSRARSAVRRPRTASHEKRTGQRDADWPNWYAEYIASGSRQASRCRYEQLEANVAPVMTSRKPAPCAVTGPPRASSSLTVISIPGCACVVFSAAGWRLAALDTGPLASRPGSYPNRLQGLSCEKYHVAHSRTDQTHPGQSRLQLQPSNETHPWFVKSTKLSWSERASERQLFMTTEQALSDEPLVWVRRQWKDWRHARYKLSDIRRLR